jgi:hypothetical protein
MAAMRAENGCADRHASLSEALLSHPPAGRYRLPDKVAG